MELLRKKRAEASRRIAKIGWAAVGGLALATAVVLMVVMMKHERSWGGGTYEAALDDFRTWILQVDLKNEDALKAANARVDKERKVWKGTRIEGDVSNQLSKIRGSLSTIIKTRSLTENLGSIDQKLATNPDTAAFATLLTQVRDADLQMQANNAGGEFKTRYEATRLRVTERYIEALRGACRSAATATSGEGPAPFGTLEDVLRTLVIEARYANDVEAIKKYEPMLTQTYDEINAICSKLFDDDYQNKVAWTDLLTDPGAWTVATSNSFKYRFYPLTMSTTASDSSQSGGISYVPWGCDWRDYVLDMEFKLDSGVMVVSTRVGEKMETKDAPSFSVGDWTGGSQVKVLVAYGKPNTMTVSTISDQMTVKVNEQVVLIDFIEPTKSRKGGPGIVVKADPASPTNLTITRLRARLLR